MPISPLSELDPGSRDWSVRVYVSRLWQHRGASDDGPIKHTDIVLQDTEGNHMYAEIAPGLVKQFVDIIQEGRVYELARFLVCAQKRSYGPVEGAFIIRFGRYTTVQEVPDAFADYPLCTYALTSIDDLPPPSDLPQAFTDVIGIITSVSPITQYHSASRSTPSTKRVIYLSNLSDYQISVIIWGERARSFDGEGVLRMTQTAPVVVIFVGTLVKPFEGRRALSGGAPCRWYINEELPEINELLTKLKDKIPAVQAITLPRQSAAEISAQVDLETKTVKELVDLNIWNHAKTKFYCTVVIAKLSPGQRWWFSACTTCNRGTVPYGTAYKCPDQNCGGVAAMPRYRLCYIGSDDTGEVEFVFFEKVGKELIGKAALGLIRSKVPHGYPIEEAVQAARSDQSTPRELATIVSRKYRLVSVTTKSFAPESDKPSYQVHRIDMQYGKHAQASASHRKPGLAFASSSSSSGSGLDAINEAMAIERMLGQTSSSDGGVVISDGTVSTEVTAPGAISDTRIPQTPPSVLKPAAACDGKDLADSTVKRALQFEDSPPRHVSKDVEGSGLKLSCKELALPVADNPDVSKDVEGSGLNLSSKELALPVAANLDGISASVATSPTDKVVIGRRQLTQKTVVEPTSKKKKA